MTAKALFVGGTASNAGKSWMVTAICAWLRSQGVSVAPFKAQNMSNNSYPCVGGGEIGRAQVAQAEACGLLPERAMNPILLKPNGNGASQLVVDGRVWKTMTAREYYACADELRPRVAAAYEELAGRFDVVVIEGAGSVSELNLREHDLVNLGLVTQLRAPWLLVADIERGGVFASVIGTVHLLTPDERALFRGFAINKFRGDMTLFEEGVRTLEERTASRCFGVFPHTDIALDAEDSLSLPAGATQPAPPDARIVIVKLPHISNATDFRLLPWADWVSSPTDADYDVIILPGTKNTMDDAVWLHESGCAAWILERHRRGALIVGICGGYQMLGRSIRDPHGVESTAGAVAGLGLVPITTELAREKQTRVVRAVTPRGVRFDAYEIHAGVTTAEEGSNMTPFAVLDDGTGDGLRGDGVIGTYLHGAFEHPDVCAEIFRIPAPAAAAKAEQYRRLGVWFARHGRHLDELGLM